MADEKKVEAVAEEVKAPETVAKADYDRLVLEYQRVSAAFNRAVTLIGNDYAEKVAKAIFEEIDKSAK